MLLRDRNNVFIILINSFYRPLSLVLDFSALVFFLRNVHCQTRKLFVEVVIWYVIKMEKAIWKYTGWAVDNSLLLEETSVLLRKYISRNKVSYICCSIESQEFSSLLHHKEWSNSVVEEWLDYIVSDQPSTDTPLIMYIIKFMSFW